MRRTRFEPAASMRTSAMRPSWRTTSSRRRTHSRSEERPSIRSPIGIAINKSNTELQSAVRKAIAMIYADGTMNTILTRWKLAGAVAKLK